MNRSALTLLSATLLLFSAPGRIPAEEPEPATPEAVAEPAWDVSVGLSYLATSGNSDSETVGLDFEATRRPMPWGLELKAQANRAAEDEVTTAERYSAGVRATRTLAERWDAFVGLSAEQDEFSGIDLRTIAEAGAVWKALVGPRHSLEFDLALTWTDEDRLLSEADERWIGGLLGASYKLAISDQATFSQDLRYFPSFDDSDDWRAESQSALTAALNQHLALRFSHEIRYRNQPIGSNDDTDATTKASLVLRR